MGPRPKFSRRALGRFAGLLALSALAPLSARPAGAATIYVEGVCSLAEAIVAANTDVSGGDCIAGFGSDVIELTGDVTLATVHNSDAGTGANGLPVISTEMTIDGRGWSIERAGGTTEFRIFKILAGGNLTLRHVSVGNGRITTAVGQNRGGGAILNLGTLSLVDSTVSGSQVVGNGAWAGGGGIYNTGTLEVTASTIRLNSAVSTTNGASGGGVLCTLSSTTTITNSTISGNYVVSTVAPAHGGGLDLLEGTALVRNSTLSGNAASTAGAALLAADDATVQGSIIANSLLSDNCAGYPDLTDGGGNQADDDSCGTIPDNLSGLDPVSRDNGGPTLTHALLPGSTAVFGAGACGLIKDQRGAPRGVLCDVGAFEYGGCPEIVLSDDTVLAAEVYESCRINVGTNYAVIGPFGHLTLRGGRDVGLDEGFSVGLDAGLSVELDSGLIP